MLSILRQVFFMLDVGTLFLKLCCGNCKIDFRYWDKRRLGKNKVLGRSCLFEFILRSSNLSKRLSRVTSHMKDKKDSCL